MPGQAQISSVEAIEAFRSQLIVYLAHMRPALEEISGEVQRTRAWLEDDRKRYWLQELRQRTRKLEDAKQELFTASLSHLGEPTSVQQMTVQRAQRNVRIAEEKLIIIKKWERELEGKTSPLVKQMEQLHGFLTVDMDHAVGYLDQVTRILAAYRDAAPQANRTEPAGGAQ